MAGTVCCFSKQASLNLVSLMSMRKVVSSSLGNLWRDLIIILLTVVLTIVLVRVGTLEQFFSFAEQQIFLGSFIAGIFFTSVFTLAPAAIALGEISKFAEPGAIAN